VDCRRILKWTYTFGYYQFAEPLLAQSKHQQAEKKQQQEFFEFNQVGPGTRRRRWLRFQTPSLASILDTAPGDVAVRAFFP
jgi:hypothetical protein